MTFDSATFVSQFNTSYPEDDATKCATDYTTIKTVLKHSFPNISGEVSASQGHLNIAKVGGTISGNLYVKGDLSASVVTVNKFNSSTSASPVSAGAVSVDLADNHLCIYTDSIKRLPPSGAMMMKVFSGTQTLSASGTFTLFQSTTTVLGENWSVSNTAAITPPRGVYEITPSLTIYGTANSSTSFVTRLQIMRGGSLMADSYYRVTKKMLSSNMNYKFSYTTHQELTLSETLTIQVVNTGDGAFQTVTGNNSSGVTVRKL